MGSGLAVGRYFKKLTIRSNDPKSPTISIPVGMTVLGDYRFSGRTFRFAAGRGGEPQTSSIEITAMNAPTLALSIEQFKIPFGNSKPEFFDAAIRRIENGHRITVTLSPDHPEGRITAELWAKIDGRNMVISIGGEMFAWIFVEPTFLRFDKVERNQVNTIQREFRLNSIDKTPFRVLSVKDGSRGKGKSPVTPTFQVSSAPNGLVHRITVGLASARGVRNRQTFSGKIVVETDHPKRQRVTLRYAGFFQRP